MSNIKNIFYECIDCKFLCKTKKEMIKHVKEVKCDENDNKLKKKNKNEENKKFNENKISFITKNNQKYLLYKNDDNNDNDNDNYLNNLYFLHILNKEIPELNLKVKKEAYDSMDNFLNNEYVDQRTLCFLKDALVVAYCTYLYDKQFNPKEISDFIKYNVLRSIKNRHDFFMNCDINILNDFKNYKFDYFEQKMLDEFKKEVFKDIKN